MRTAFFFILALIPIQLESQDLSQNNELRDVRSILSTRSGSVKKWAYPPEVSVLHTGEFDSSFLNEVIDFINSNTDLGIEGVKEQKDINTIDGGLFGETRLRYIKSEHDNLVTTKISFSDGETMSANIFIYKLDIALSSLFLVMSRSAKGAWSLSRQFVEGNALCFFHALSLRDEIRAAHIFVRNDLSIDVERACIYEELVQAMGLLSDAPGSMHFTFDNIVAPKADPLDWKILKALYAENIEPGSDVDSVLRNYMEVE